MHQRSSELGQALPFPKPSNWQGFVDHKPGRLQNLRVGTKSQSCGPQKLRAARFWAHVTLSHCDRLKSGSQFPGLGMALIAKEFRPGGVLANDKCCPCSIASSICASVQRAPKLSRPDSRSSLVDVLGEHKELNGNTRTSHRDKMISLLSCLS